MQLGGQVDSSAKREYGPAVIEPLMPSVLSGLSQVWMSHGDRITRMPEGFIALARSDNSPFAAIGDMQQEVLWRAIPSGSASHAQRRAGH